MSQRRFSQMLAYLRPRLPLGHELIAMWVGPLRGSVLCPFTIGEIFFNVYAEGTVRVRYEVDIAVGEQAATFTDPLAAAQFILELRNDGVLSLGPAAAPEQGREPVGDRVQEAARAEQPDEEEGEEVQPLAPPAPAAEPLHPVGAREEVPRQ